MSLPLWWIRSAQKATEDWDLEELASALSKAASRAMPWRRETVGKFLKNKHATYELMLAFCTQFDELLQPVFIADTYEEAHQLLLTLRRIRQVESNPEKEARRTVLKQAREHIEQRAADQTKRLDSVDEGIGNRRRPRGLGAGRPPTKRG